MPSPAFALKGKKTDPGVTNVRNTSSPHWHSWLSLEHRCLVPLADFSEPERQPDGNSKAAWFALGEDRPLTFFARSVGFGPVRSLTRLARTELLSRIRSGWRAACGRAKQKSIGGYRR
jgi:hypothetical protein